MTAHDTGGPDDGGPAFPVQNSYEWQWTGVTIRDYFAAKAMSRVADYACNRTWDAENHAIADITRIAYRIADAMIAARKA